MTQRQLSSLIIAAIVACTLFLVGLITDDFWLRLACKPFPHLAALAWLLTRPYPEGKTRLVNATAAGLGLCLVGDFLLEFRQTLFVYGVGAFVLAHFAYIVGFLSSGHRFRLERLIPFVTWVVVVFLAIGVERFGKMLVPVLVYMAAICMLMYAAAARIGGRGNPTVAEWSGLVGAVLIAIGDTLIAIDRFGESRIENVRYPIILTYWAALAFVAFSAGTDRPDREPKNRTAAAA